MIKVGIKHCSLKKSKICAFINPSFDWNNNIGDNTISKTGENFCWEKSNFSPSGMMGLGQESEFFPNDAWDEDDFLRWVVAVGSVNTTAVAGNVLGTKNPVFSKDVENIDITFAPSIPSTITAKSARTAGF